MRSCRNVPASWEGCSADVESGVYEQLRSLTAALITGGGLGLLFDMTRLASPRSRALSSILLELPFLLFGAFAVFVVGQRSGAGMRLYFLLGAAGGFFLYLGLIHESVSARISQVKHDLHTYSTGIEKQCSKVYNYLVKTIKKYKK